MAVLGRRDEGKFFPLRLFLKMKVWFPLPRCSKNFSSTPTGPSMLECGCGSLAPASSSSSSTATAR